MADEDDKAAEAESEIRRARFIERIWWAQLPVVCVSYWLVSREPPIEKAILVYLAAVSIIAIAATYGSKAKGAEAKKAGYEHP